MPRSTLHNLQSKTPGQTTFNIGKLLPPEKQNPSPEAKFCVCLRAHSQIIHRKFALPKTNQSTNQRSSQTLRFSPIFLGNDLVMITDSISEPQYFTHPSLTPVLHWRRNPGNHLVTCPSGYLDANPPGIFCKHLCIPCLFSNLVGYVGYVAKNHGSSSPKS